MSHDQGHEGCGGDAAAYVLGALSPAEAQSFQQHMEQCAICRDEVEALQGVVRALPMAAPQLAPPRRLRRRVMRAARGETRSARGTSKRRFSVTRSASPQAILGGLATAAVMAAGIITAVELSGTEASHRVFQARVIGISGSARVLLSNGHGELVVDHLPAPPSHHVYEVWLKRPNEAPTPASVLFSVNPAGNADVGLPRSLRGVSQVMVTAEPDGGSPLPTSNPVIIARLD